jgi:hypothetical protein
MNILQAIQALDEALTRENQTQQLIICGGAALHLQGLSSRATKDVDVLSPEITPELFVLTQEIAEQQNLSPDWLNNGPQSLIHDLEEEWEQRISIVYQGSSLTIHSLGRNDLIFSKFYAMCDRRQDIHDLLSMKVTTEEIHTAATMIKPLDGNPNWPNWIDICVAELLKELPHDK